MYFKCCIPISASKREETKLHKFLSDEDQRNKWLDFINCDTLKSMHSSNLNKMLVCHKHFEKRFHTVKSGIKKTAYPTLFSFEEIESVFSSRSCNNKGNVLVDHTYICKRHYDHTYCKIKHSPLLKPQNPLIDLTNIPSTSFAPSSHLDNLENVPGELTLTTPKKWSRRGLYKNFLNFLLNASYYTMNLKSREGS
ncbi:unnamed protein product [Parnassius apollo]|uniref:(apollo) hypothetical protein n=1 Tax=Parnassius apollo TaxID=110799 RepID=A0A8S3XU82_PARAO|nr:unnamed protein product [Parnassius apollo]